MLGIATTAALTSTANHAYSQPLTGGGCQSTQQTLQTNINYNSLDEKQVAELGIEINNYAESDNSGVGILVIVGNDLIGKTAASGNIVTPEYLANVFQSKLDAQNVPSKICYGFSSRYEHTSIAFELKNQSFENLDIVNALDKINDVINAYQTQNIAALNNDSQNPDRQLN